MDDNKFVVKAAGKIYTAKFRLSFGVIETPQRYNDMGDPRYSMSMLFPKADTSMDLLKSELKKAEQSMRDWGGTMPSHGRYPIEDGDTTKNKNGNPIKKNAGMWVVSAATPSKIKGGGEIKLVLKNRDKTDIVPGSGVFYDGCWCRAIIRAQAYENSQQNLGLKFRILGVQFWADDEPFGGGAADDDFDHGGDDDDDEVPF